MSETYTEALTAQCQMILNLGRQLDEKGYALVVHGLNRDADHERFPYGYFLGALDKFARDWATASERDRPRRIGDRDDRRRPVFVHIHPLAEALAAIWTGGKVLDQPFNFLCAIPTRVRYREIHSTLGLMSRTQKGRLGTAQGSGVLHAARCSDTVEYRGVGRDELQILIQVLEMPQSRKILRGEIR